MFIRSYKIWYNNNSFLKSPMPLIQMRSPRGGNPLSSIWSGPRADKNLTLKPKRKPEMFGDFLVFKVGYAAVDTKKGEPICIKRSDARKLLKILRQMFGE